MSLLLQELIERSCEEAEHQLGTQEDLTQVANAYALEAAKELSDEVAGDEQRRPMLMQAKTLTVIAGVATLTDDVLVEYLDDAEVYDPADLTKEYGRTKQRVDFRAEKGAVGTLSGCWIVEGQTYSQLEPGKSFSGTLEFTGSITLEAICSIGLPASATTAITIHPQLEDDLVSKLTSKIVGDVKKTV